MGSIKALIYASVVAAGAVQTAQAADLLPPPPPIEAPPLRGPIEDSGFYLRGDLGVGVNEVSSRTSSFGSGATMQSLSSWYGPSTMDSSYLIGIGAGYKFNNWFRADVTGEYRSSGLYKSANYYSGSNRACVGLPAGICGDTYRGQLSIGLFLANAYLDLGTWYGITPYVGAGVGVASWSMGSVVDNSLQSQSPVNGQPSTNGGGFSQASAGTNFAWDLTGGVAYNISQNLKLDVSYRYVNMGSINTGAILCTADCWYESQHFKLASNDVRVGLRWMVDPGVVYEAPGVRARY